MKLKLVSLNKEERKNRFGMFTNIINADTGEVLGGVSDIDYVDRIGEAPKLILTLLEFEIEVSGMVSPTQTIGEAIRNLKK